MDAVVVDATKTEIGEDSDSRTKHSVPQCFWLNPGYIFSRHCRAMAARMKVGLAEISDDAHVSRRTSQTTKYNGSSDNLDHVTTNDTSQSSTEQKVDHTAPLTKNKIANEATSMMYRLFTTVPSRFKNASKPEIFYDLIYLFVSRSHHGCRVNPESLRFIWKTLMTDGIDNIDGLAWKSVKSNNEQWTVKRRDLDQIDLDNIAHLETLIAELRELSITVEKDVTVNGAVTQLRFSMSFTGMVCLYLASFVTLGSAAKSKDALRADKRSLQVIGVLAIDLRKLLNKAICDMSAYQTVAWYNNSGTKITRKRPRRSSVNNSSTI